MAEGCDEGDQVGGRYAYPLWQSPSTTEDSDEDVDKVTGNFNKKERFSGPSIKFPWLERKQRLMELSIFNEPQCLIKVDDEGALIVNDKTAIEIKDIDVPLSVVAITGLYRTGKSYLLNKISGCPTDKTGFSLGNSVKSHTKGMWVWCCIHPSVEEQIILYIDTEGLADIEKGDSDHDNRIFSLAVLMSSTLIYNSKDVFNADDIKKLSFIANLSENISSFADVKKDKGVDKAVLGIVTPTFILCLRDFYLDLQNKTSDEYFEDCLSSFRSEITECIKAYFPRRKCFTIEHPATGPILRTLNKANDTDLEEGFIKDVNELREYIESRDAKEIISKRPIDGQGFVSLLKSYTNCLKKGIPMNIEEAIDSVSKEHNKKVNQETLRWLRNEVRLIPLPKPRKEQLQIIFFQLQDKVIRMYRKHAYPYKSDHFESILQKKMNDEWDALRVENSKCIKKKCKAVLTQIDASMVKEEEFYNSDGMFKVFKEDIRRVESTFYDRMNNYDRDELIDPIEDYKSSKKGIKAELCRRESELAVLKQQEQLERKLEEKFQEKIKEIERERNEFIEKERNRLLDNIMKQQELNGIVLTETLRNVQTKKRNCVIS